MYADDGGWNLDNFLGGADGDGEVDGFADDGCVGVAKGGGVVGCEGDFCDGRFALNVSSFCHINSDSVGGKGLSLDEEFFGAGVTADVFGVDVAHGLDARGADVPELFDFFDDFFGDKHVLTGVFARLVFLDAATAHHALHLGQDGVWYDAQKSVAAERFNLFVDEGVDAGGDGGVEDDGEAADEDGEDGEEGAEFVAKEVAVGGFDDVAGFHYAAPFLILSSEMTVPSLMWI